jgi:hypothetical protein
MFRYALTDSQRSAAPRVWLQSRLSGRGHCSSPCRLRVRRTAVAIDLRSLSEQGPRRVAVSAIHQRQAVVISAIVCRSTEPVPKSVPKTGDENGSSGRLADRAQADANKAAAAAVTPIYARSSKRCGGMRKRFRAALIDAAGWRSHPSPAGCSHPILYRRVQRVHAGIGVRQGTGVG